MNLSTVATVGILFLACTTTKALAWWEIFQSDQEEFLQKCEDTFSMRILSPASYQRSQVIGPQRVKADLNDYLNRQTQEIRWFRDVLKAKSPAIKEAEAQRRKIFRTGEFEVVKFTILYDADNTYGTAIRGSFVCSQVVRTGEQINLNTIGGPKVDYFDYIDWPLFMSWKLNR